MVVWIRLAALVHALRRAELRDRRVQVLEFCAGLAVGEPEILQLFALLLGGKDVFGEGLGPQDRFSAVFLAIMVSA